MKLPNWRDLQLGEGVLCEPTPDGSQLVLWLRGDFSEGWQEWERIANVPGARITSQDGLFSTQATVIRARRKTPSLFGKLLQVFRNPTGGRNWLLPNGNWAEQVGERLIDRVLVWGDNDTPLNDKDLETNFGPESHVRKLATHLFVTEFRSVRNEPTATETPPHLKPLDQAKILLDAARKAKDCPKQASALIDLGVIHLREGQVPLALDLLTRALRIARKFNDPGITSDAQTNLAKALLAAGQTDKGRQLLEAELTRARASADQFHEKMVLDYLAALRRS